VNAQNYLGIQVKTLSKRSAVPLGIKGVDNLVGDWWIIVSKITSEIECFVIKPQEVSKLAVRDAGGVQAYWLPARAYEADKFRENWERIGRGDLAPPKKYQSVIAGAAASTPRVAPRFASQRTI
jgi:hypothetical protein